MNGPYPIITLTTDFGLADGTVGAMVGVIKSICPGSEIVFNAVDVPVHDIPRGAWAILQAVPFYPSDSVHIVVVDPGVGTRRRGILTSTDKGFLIGPDNGVMSWALQRIGGYTAYELTNPAYRLSGMGVTFDGRDLFASAAAHLARGADPSTFGPKIEDLESLDWPEPVVDDVGIAGEILVVDHFGNLVSNVSYDVIAEYYADASLRVKIDDTICALVGSYDAITGTLGAVINGAGLLEIAGHRQSAASRTGLKRGAHIRVYAESKKT